MDFTSFVEQDSLELLAAMCAHCEPLIVRGDLVRWFSSVYIPQNEEDIEIAKRLFNDNGIDIKVCNMRVDYGMKQPVFVARSLLRRGQFEKVSRFVGKIEKTMQEIAQGKNYDKWWKLQETLNKIRQEENQK